jgi:hypothetical protein
MDFIFNEIINGDFKNLSKIKINTFNKKRDNIFLHCSKNNNFIVFELLVKHFLSKTRTFHDNKLFTYLIKNNLNKYMILLINNSKLLIDDKFLMLCVKKENVEICKYLIEFCGVCINYKEDFTCVQIASSIKNIELLKIFLYNVNTIYNIDNLISIASNSYLLENYNYLLNFKDKIKSDVSSTYEFETSLLFCKTVLTRQYLIGMRFRFYFCDDIF